MGGNDNGRIFRRVLGNGLAELGLGRNVQAVGGFVHVIVAGPAGQGEGNPGLLELAGAHAVHLLLGIHLEFTQDFQEHLHVEAGPHAAGLAGEGYGLCLNRLDLVGQVELLGQQGRLPAERIALIYQDTPLLRLFEPAKKREQGGFTHTVFAQKPVDVSLTDVQTDVVQDGFGAVTEAEVLDLNHIFCVY